MVEATIKLTKTMLDKSIIDANKTVQQFLTDDFEMSYDDPCDDWSDNPIPKPKEKP